MSKAAAPLESAERSPGRGRSRARSQLLELAPALVPGLAIALYWVQSLAQGDSLSMAAIYRYGDYTYFPALAGLANFSLGESLVFEQLGEGIRSFPFPPLALHGLSIGLLGPVGLPVADVLIAVCTYLAARRFFRACALLPVTCEVLALLIACAVLGPPVGLPAKWPPELLLWGYRLPRPFVTDLFLLLAVGSWLRIFVGGHRCARDWLVLGLWFGLLLQSRFYSAATLGLAIGVGGGLLLVLRDRQLASTAKGVGAFALTAAFVLLPFVAQRLFEHPDVPVRFGTFSVNRLEPLWIEGRFWDVLQVLGVALVAGLAIHGISPPKAAVRLRVTGALVLLCLLSTLALPVSTILLGQTVQPYHFLTEVIVFKTLAIVACVGQLADVATTAIARSMPGAAWIRWLRPGLLGLVALVGIAASVQHHNNFLSKSSHFRMEFPSYSMPDYRVAFGELIRELASERYRNARVLGTLDIQVHAWWSLFGGGQVFLPDPFATVLPDDEIEERLLIFLHKNGVSSEDAWHMLHNFSVLIFFLSCDKYQASPAHTYSSLDDYPKELRASLRSMSVFDSWHVMLPISEAQRLMEKYARVSGAQNDRRLDVIVLGRSRLDGRLEPNPTEFEPSYENRVFRVYTRRLP